MNKNRINSSNNEGEQDLLIRSDNIRSNLKQTIDNPLSKTKSIFLS
jgi:hypothetical protein